MLLSQDVVWDSSPLSVLYVAYHGHNFGHVMFDELFAWYPRPFWINPMLRVGGTVRVRTMFRVVVLSMLSLPSLLEVGPCSEARCRLCSDS